LSYIRIKSDYWYSTIDSCGKFTKFAFILFVVVRNKFEGKGGQGLLVLNPRAPLFFRVHEFSRDAWYFDGNLYIEVLQILCRDIVELSLINSLDYPF
jgi:hypothetical protein